MFSNRLAFAALAIACVSAAAGGAFLATRQNAAPVVAATAPAHSESTTPAQPVQETEAVVAEAESSVPHPPSSNAIPGSSRTAEAVHASNSTRAASTPSRSTPAAPSRADARSRPVAPASSGSTASSGSSASSGPSRAAIPEPPANTPNPELAPTTAAAAPEPAAPSVRDDPARTPEVARAPEPPAKTLEELVVSADSVLGLQMETAVSSERAKVEDRVEARVARDVKVNGQVAIPAGARAIGSVMLVEKGGKLKDRARLGIRFHTLVLADGTRMPISTETVYRQGDAPGNASAAKIGGGAVAGAILGAIIGGSKGAAIGGTVGAGAGTTAVMTGDRSAATFPVGTEVTARILSPVTVTVEK